MDIFSKKSGDYWATVAIEEDADGTFSWNLRLALELTPERSWVVASERGFTASSAASTEGMDALGLLDAAPPSENSFAIADSLLRTRPSLH